MLSPKETFLELCDFDFAPFTQLNVCLASKDESGVYSYQRLVMSDSLKDEFVDLVKQHKILLHKRNKNDALEVVPYEEYARAEDHQLAYIDHKNHETLLKQITSLSGYSNFESFNNDEAFINGLKFYVIAIDMDFYCFRIFTAKKELGRSGFFGAWLEGNHYNKFTDKMLLFDDDLDCIFYKGYLFILKAHYFKRIFNFFEKLKEVAIESLENIKQTLPIANFEGLEKIGQTNQIVQMKLKSISSKDYIKTLSIQQIKETIENFPELNLEVIAENGKEQLKFDPKNMWNFLKLLDDGLLHSRMTNYRYSVSDKRKV